MILGSAYGQNYVYDESYLDESFLEFKLKLTNSIIRKDTAELYSLLADTLYNGPNRCNNQPKECFKKNFRNQTLRIEEMAFWGEIYAAISFGFANYKKENGGNYFQAPSFRKYFFSSDFSELLVLGYNVNIREKPSKDSKILETVSFEKLKYNNHMISDSPSAYNYIDGKFWYEVVLKNDEKGYIIEDYVSPYYNTDLRVKKINGQWKITAIAQGPGC